MTDDKSKVARLHYRKYSVLFPLRIWLLTKWLYNCYVTCMHSMKCMQGYLTEIFQKMKNDIFSLHILIQYWVPRASALGYLGHYNLASFWKIIFLIATLVIEYPIFPGTTILTWRSPKMLYIVPRKGYKSLDMGTLENFKHHHWKKI